MAWYVQAKAYGPIASGALFGAAWFFWMDAVAVCDTKVSFLQVPPSSPADPSYSTNLIGRLPFRPIFCSF